MTTSIALLRGINVGGHRKIPMADLRRIFVDGGYDDVETYIQSGNVVFGHGRTAPAALVARLEALIEEATGFAVPVIVRSAAELATVVAGNPFPGTDDKLLHVAFFGEAPDRGAVEGIDVSSCEPERFVLAGRELFLSLPNGMGRAKLPQVMKKVLAPATARNWRTVTTLAEMSAR